MVDFVKSLLGEFDPTALLPDLWAIFDKLDVALRVVVLAGPLCLLGLGTRRCGEVSVLEPGLPFHSVRCEQSLTRLRFPFSGLMKRRPFRDSWS